MHLKTLGGLELSSGGLGRPKPLLLLAYLILEGAKERHHLGDLFYPDTQNPLASLRVALQHLRERAKGVLVTEGPLVKAAVSADALELLRAADRLDYPEVLRLYRGTFLDGVYLKAWSPELEEWVFGTREHLAGLVRHALLRLGEACLREGDAGAGARYAGQAYRLPAAPPLEPEQLTLMHALLQAGNHPYAAELRREVEDLGVPFEPLPGEAVRGDGVRLGAKTPPTAPNNLSAPATSFVGREGEIERLARYLEAPRSRVLTLVGPGGVGKTRLALELARTQLGRPSWDGVYFVALDALREAALIPPAIAQALSYKLSFNLQGSAPPLDELLDHIGQRRLLLVLDNYEQLTSGKDVVVKLVQTCPNVSLIITSRERLHLAWGAVYTVEGLAVPGDRDPGVGAALDPSVQLFVERAASADLRFRLTPDTEPHVRDICRGLEGSPLGIELAAAWVRAMTPGDIVRQLGSDPGLLQDRRQDAPERHRSLRAVFEGSWRLLTAQEQAVLKRLSVFRGGFRREAAADVANASIPVLASLIDKSLLRLLPSGRYDRHLLLYQFAAEKLAEDPSERHLYEARHARYVLALAEEAHGELRSVAQARWLARLEEESGNLRAALAWSLERHQVDLSLQLVSALGLYWYIAASFEEGRAWFDRVLAQPHLPPTRLHARALHGAGRLARSFGDFGQAKARLEAAHGLFEALGDAAGTVDCLNELGILAAAQADYPAALALFGRGYTVASSLGDDAQRIILGGNLGLAEAIVGNLGEAQRLNEACLALSRQHGNEHGVAHALDNLALIATQAGDYERAGRFYREGWAAAQNLGNPRLMAEALLGRGTVHVLSGNALEAQVLIKRSLELYLRQKDNLGVIDVLIETANLAAICQEQPLALRLWGATEVSRTHLNFPLRPFARRRYEAVLERVRAEVPERVFRRAWAEGELWSLGEATAQALAWLGAT